ncbi:MAG: hypothetical protein XU10_C0018G0059 [Chloroflexi bacterium CSP1-4]|nr:MAG: hypothetical protein XU10_C0018G0059 [Chloroflexi bacterium CSP1-4]
MPHLRPILAVVVIAALATACSSAPGGGSSEPSFGGGEPSSGGGEATTTPGSGGGGGGGGANGSLTYQITGGYEASGELPFQPLISLFDPSTDGWVAYFTSSSGEGAIVTFNTQAAGQIINFGDGTAVVIGTSDPGSGSGCTFTLTKNDASGMVGHVECTSALLTTGDGTIGQTNFSAQWDAHP